MLQVVKDMRMLRDEVQHACHAMPRLPARAVRSAIVIYYPLHDALALYISIM